MMQTILRVIFVVTLLPAKGHFDDCEEDLQKELEMSAKGVVNFDDVKRFLEDIDNIFVDVREPDELRAGAIPRSLNIPLGEVEEAFKDGAEAFNALFGREISPDGANVVFSCRSGRRAEQAREIVREFGFTEAKLYKGSYLDWVARGGIVEKSEPIRNIPA